MTVSQKVYLLNYFSLSHYIFWSVFYNGSNSLNSPWFLSSYALAATWTLPPSSLEQLSWCVNKKYVKPIILSSTQKNKQHNKRICGKTFHINFGRCYFPRLLIYQMLYNMCCETVGNMLVWECLQINTTQSIVQRIAFANIGFIVLC